MLFHYLLLVLLLQVIERPFLRKTLTLLEEIEKVFNIKLGPLYGDKGHIKPLFLIRNIQYPNGKITWIPKCTSTNPKGSTS